MVQNDDWTFLYAPTADGQMGTIGSIWQLGNDEFFPENEVLAVPADPSKTVVVRLRFGIEAGSPVCTAMSFEQPAPRDGPKGPSITAKVIRSVDVGDLIAEAKVWLATNAKAIVHTYKAVFGDGYTVGQDGRFSFWTAEDQRSARDDALSRHRRRLIDDTHLRYVAQIYRAATKAPTETVAEQIGTSKRNATRWVAMARERGFLAPYDPSGPQGEEN